AERSVELLRSAAARGDIELELVPGLSFAELAWARLGVDPMSGARLADARHLTAEDAVGGGPVLIAQCDTRLLLSDVKLVLLEEAYEVVEAVEALPPDAPAGDVPADAYRALEDELGDLLYQVIFHAVLAEEAGAFDMADVARGIHDKLVRRHPHVFGDIDAETTSDVMRNCEQIKKDEKGPTSIVAGIPP